MTALSAGVLVLALVFLATACIVLALVGGAVVRRRRRLREGWVGEFLSVGLSSATVAQLQRVVEKNTDAFMRAYMELSDSLELPADLRRKVQRALSESGVETRLLHQTLARRAWKRARAAAFLGYVGGDNAMRTLVFALEREPIPAVRLHMIDSLVRLGYPAAIPTIVDSLSGASREYQQRVQGLLGEFGAEAMEYFPILRNRREYEVQLLLLHLAGRYPDAHTKRYVEERLESDIAAVRHIAARTYLHSFANREEITRLIGSEDRLIANLALEALARSPGEENFERAAAEIGNPATAKSAVLSLAEMVRRAPHLYATLLRVYAETKDEDDRARLLEVMAIKTEYLVERYIRTREDFVAGLIRRLMTEGWTGGVLAFLNRNDDGETEKAVADLIRPQVRGNAELRSEFAQYAKASVRSALGIEQVEIGAERGERRGEAVRRRTVLLVMIGTILLPLGAFAGWWFLSGRSVTLLPMVTGYLRVFLWGFGGYAAVLNLSYVALLGLAALERHRQARNYSIKSLSMLFRTGMLPSISVIVPAYREEATIVSNVNSLLNLRYPDFEVVVVNDGSPDATLQALIDHFELERVDVFIHAYLRTQAIRGVYRNPEIPELLVIDKKNGGKADSLNAGINASRKEYFAAIDSDSILERDALLHMTAHFVDSPVPVVASGGNVLPVNGCSVDRGVISRARLPRSPLAAFQTVEYIRSFMAGRTGWARVNSLMIISGAFGLFRKRDVVDVRGYLTGSEALGKDTVAEDMELVVRISRSLREQGRRFAVQYAPRANCWTEVPESLKILRNQRDRWHRGLIDTMSFHRRMLGNPRYGAMGLIGFPFYGIFELLGPWIEMQGLLFLVLSAVTAVVAPGVLLLVFAVSIPLGMLISLAALLLARETMGAFPFRDRVLFVLLSAVENFGYRQYASLLRIRGYISALQQRTGWGTMVRRGFAAQRSGEDSGGSATGGAA